MFEEVNKNNIEESIKTKTSLKETLESLSEIAESHGLEDLFSDSIAALTLFCKSMIMFSYSLIFN